MQGTLKSMFACTVQISELRKQLASKPLKNLKQNFPTVIKIAISSYSSYQCVNSIFVQDPKGSEKVQRYDTGLLCISHALIVMYDYTLRLNRVYMGG